MSIENVKIFEAQGKSLEVAREWMARREAAHAAREALAHEFDPKAKTFGTDHSFCGITSSLDLSGKGWKESSLKIERTMATCWEPNKKTKAGKELTQRMNSKELRVPSAEDLSGRLGFDLLLAPMGHGMAIFYVQAQKVGDKILLFVPDAKKLKVTGPAFTPADAIPMKPSEYFALMGQ